MYPLSKIQTLLLSGVIVLSVASLSVRPVAAAEQGHGKPHTGSVVAVNWPNLPDLKQLKKAPEGVSIYQFDTTSIDNRQPLLMVHGLLGEFWRGFRWTKLATYLNADPEFRSKYKIYMARYSTHAPLNKVSPFMDEAIIRLSESTGNSRVGIIALSMGGNVVERSLQNPAVNKIVDRVMTMGTPFHGSPLFTSDWMQYSMLQHYRMPIGRVDTILPYQLYFDRHKNLLADLKWDNTDKLIPAVGNFKTYFPYKIYGDLSPSISGNAAIVDLNKACAVDKSKFIVYGGYLANEYAVNKRTNPILWAVKFPAWFTGTTLPEHMGREHAVLRELNQHIARVIPNDTDKARTGYAYGLNDGIAPLSSSLYLPDHAMSPVAFTPEAQVENYKSRIDVRKARVFGNIDHLTFIDGYKPRGGKTMLRDELSPGEKERPIFAWILDDLKNTAPAAPGMLGAK